MILPEYNETDFMQAVINAAPTPIFYKDAQGRYLGCNKAFEEYIGLNREQLIGKSVLELFDDELARTYFEADNALFERKGTQIYEAKVEYADGTTHDVMFHKAYFHAEGIEGIVGSILDITERKKAEESLEQLALSDSLTGLDNRYSLMKSLKHSLLRQHRENFTLAFLMLDLDGFKQINDNYGHPVGDALLIEVANKLKNHFRESDVIARVGGDEFSVILENIHSTESLIVLANNILAEFLKPFVIDNNKFTIGISIGIATSSFSECSSEDIIKHADAALYQVKNSGKGSYHLTVVN
ncbi:sensor domain-containing protein [Colwellia sp. Bg11-28]|uniref:sensor domain-containing protein n=1 Tax=Colwellia sp. Bg11-28 TaxID=2058305 RepID=UPI000C31E771|nr:GGDEF domain-containing protein [Colwellia sp. Bg11-28]PKH85091.1 sensor domain-containing diguanylate cyclase [Colwellia sp. Bg11-28]